MYGLAFGPNTVPELAPFIQPDASRCAKFVLARSDDPEVASGGVVHDNGKLAIRAMATISHGVLFKMLAPHEILSLTRSCKTLWNTTSSPGFTCAMLSSVLGYLRVSAEAATAVANWKVTLPKFVKLCEDLVTKVYGPFEPDALHRAILAENIAFADNISHPDLPVSKILTQLDQNGEIGEEFWGSLSLGDPASCFEPGFNEQGGTLSDRMMKNVEWMQAVLKAGDSAGDVANECQKLRIKAGLHPIIFLIQDNSCESEEYGVGIGQNREQEPFRMSSFYEVMKGEAACVDRESFTCCGLTTPDVGPFGSLAAAPLGLVGYLVLIMFGGTDDETAKALIVARALWCRLHDIAPFNNPEIPWNVILQKYWSHNELVSGALNNPAFRRVLC